MKRFITLSISALFAVGAWAEEPLSGEYVDLGLSVKWATCNLGATSSTDAGRYLAWGETSTKTNYTWETYLSDLGGTMTQYEDAGTDKDPLKDYVYGGSHSEGIGATAYDAATAALGAGYRMPTLEEFEELANTDNCEWVWYDEDNTEFNGVAGYKVTSKKTGYTGNSIFLPAAGYRDGEDLNNEGPLGVYWSSTPIPDDANYAGHLYFYSDDVYLDAYNDRSIGFQVRPVYAAIAQIGETIYTSLQDAFAAVQNGDVVKLLKDIEINKPISVENKEFILDLNGKAINSTITYGYAVLYFSECELTITGNGTVDAGNVSSAIYAKNSEIVIENGTFVGNDEGACFEESKFAIEGGTFSGIPQGICAYGCTESTISGGAFTVNEWVSAYFVMSAVTISGGTFNAGDEEAIFVEGGSVTIANGHKYQGESESLAAGTYTESITFAGEVVSIIPTAIEGVDAPAAQKAVKTIENGKVVIIRGDKKYDLSGREL